MRHRASILAVTAVIALGATACGSDGSADVTASNARAPATAAPALRWEEAAPSPLTPRAHSVGVWIGEEVLVVGGDTFMCPPGADCMTPTEPPLSDGAAFDPRSGTWRRIAAAPVGFSSAATAVVGDDVYFWARVGAGSANPSPAFLRYSVVDDAWTRLPIPEPAHPWYDMVAAGDVIVAYSGSDERGEQPDLVFDPGTKEWDALPNDPLGPAFDRTLVWSSPFLYLFDHALVPNPGSERPSLTRATRLDLASGEWERLPDSEILGTGPWFVEDDRLVNPTLGSADGGDVNNWGRSYPEGGIFDTATMAWIPLPAAPDGAHSAGALGSRDALYLATDGVLLDLVAEEWVDLPALPEDGELTERALISAGADAFAFGGVRWTETRGELLADAWIWRSGRGTDASHSGAPDTTTSHATVTLGRSGGCADAYFWAATAEEDVAVTAYVDVRDRSTTEPTVVDFTLPDLAVEVEIQAGRALTQPFCNDVVDANRWRVDSETAAVAGTGRITVDPAGTAPGECGGSGARGVLHLEGLVAEDGTRFAPIDVATAGIGCYAG